MPWCTQQVKWVPRWKCFEYSGLSNSKVEGNSVTTRKCMYWEYSFNYLKMLLHSFAYINHRPSFGGGTPSTQYSWNLPYANNAATVQRCQCHWQQQRFCFLPFPRHNSRPVGQWHYLLLCVKLPDPPMRWHLHGHWFWLAPDLFLLTLTCDVVCCPRETSRSSTISCISCFLFLEEASRICAGRLLLTWKWRTLLTPIALDPLVTLFVL